MPRFRNGALSPRQQRFIEEYLVDSNATQAAIRAGYSPRIAQQIGAVNMRNHVISQAISNARTKLSEQTGITAAWVETRLMEVVERCMQHKPVMDKNGKQTGTYTFDAAGANRALELLGRRFKMFVEKVATTDATGEGTAPLHTLPTEMLLALAAKIRQRQAAEETSSRGDPQEE